MTLRGSQICHVPNTNHLLLPKILFPNGGTPINIVMVRAQEHFVIIRKMCDLSIPRVISLHMSTWFVNVRGKDALINETQGRHQLLVGCHSIPYHTSYVSHNIANDRWHGVTCNVTLRHNDGQGVFKGGIGLSRHQEEITVIISTHQ